MTKKILDLLNKCDYDEIKDFFIRKRTRILQQRLKRPCTILWF